MLLYSNKDFLNRFKVTNATFWMQTYVIRPPRLLNIFWNFPSNKNQLLPTHVTAPALLEFDGSSKAGTNSWITVLFFSARRTVVDGRQAGFLWPPRGCECFWHQVSAWSRVTHSFTYQDNYDYSAGYNCLFCPIGCLGHTNQITTTLIWWIQHIIWFNEFGTTLSHQNQSARCR